MTRGHVAQSKKRFPGVSHQLHSSRAELRRSEVEGFAPRRTWPTGERLSSSRRVVRLLVVALLILSSLASAHETLPASFTLTETAPDVFDAQLRLPAREGPAPSIEPRLPDGCTREGDLRDLPDRGAQVMRVTMKCPGLQRKEIWLAGLDASKIEVLARAQFLDGTRVTRVMRAGQEV